MNYKVTIPIIVIIVLAGGYGVWQWQKTEQPVDENEVIDTETATSTWQTYRNETYGISLQFPAEWQIKEESGSISMYDPAKQDDFYSSNEFTVSFVDDVANGEEAILKDAQVTYPTVKAYIDGEPDVYAQGVTTIDNAAAMVLLLGAEEIVENYYIPSQIKENAFIIVSTAQTQPLKDDIIKSIRLERNSDAATGS